MPRRAESGDVVGLRSLESLTLDFMPGVMDAPQSDTGVRLVETGAGRSVGSRQPGQCRRGDRLCHEHHRRLCRASEIAHLNDGLYGKDAHSWIGNSDETFAGVNLNGSHMIGSIQPLAVTIRDEYTDRNAGTYTLQYTTVAHPDDATLEEDWLTIDELIYDGTFPADEPQLRHVYEFDPVEVTGVRILVSSHGGGGASDLIAIDEIEVFAPTRSAIEDIGELTALRHLSLDGTRAIQPAPLVGDEGQRGASRISRSSSGSSIDATVAWQPSERQTGRRKWSRESAMSVLQVLSLRRQPAHRDRSTPLATLDEAPHPGLAGQRHPKRGGALR